MKSKILLLILTTVLCVSLIPITVQAEAEPTEFQPTELESTELQPSDYSLTVSITHDWDDEVRLDNVIEYTYYVKNT